MGNSCFRIRIICLKKYLSSYSKPIGTHWDTFLGQMNFISCFQSLIFLCSSKIGPFFLCEKVKIELLDSKESLCFLQLLIFS
ncbi:hypothetical protein Lalb_Chr17g0336421 [Lupinus albus]|uniref:Uncharacterized protein n=1 Tax=Lupinus albus TaxID=3870 RepID=A0A6A4P0U2_LUPAL|nr:hypothetical protein Lalb_Chr17g0336421 [Lupinus albus]